MSEKDISEEYNELVEIVAQALETDLIAAKYWHDEAKAAIRAIQDYLPDFDTSHPEAVPNFAWPCLRFKHMGRDDV